MNMQSVVHKRRTRAFERKTKILYWILDEENAINNLANNLKINKSVKVEWIIGSLCIYISVH